MVSWQLLQLLGGVLVLALVSGHLLWWFERGHNPKSFPPEYPRGMLEAMWWIASTIITGGCDDKHVDGPLGRALAFGWMVGGIGLIAAFTSVLTATMTAERVTGMIYGPRDPHIVPRMIARRRQGRLRRVGDGSNQVGITYVDNAAQAHLLAADRLGPGAACAGRAYFITDAEPVTLWSWIDALLVAVGEQPVPGSVSVGTAVTAGRLLQWAWGTFGLAGEPPMTPFVAKELASSHWYDLRGAREDLGYAPAVSGTEGFARTVAWFKAHPPA
jgi:hypothetical protein